MVPDGFETGERQAAPPPFAAHLRPALPTLRRRSRWAARLDSQPASRAGTDRTRTGLATARRPGPGGVELGNGKDKLDGEGEEELVDIGCAELVTVLDSPGLVVVALPFPPVVVPSDVVLAKQRPLVSFRFVEILTKLLMPRLSAVLMGV